eukprot:15354514-Ditylum_brightwellii.AAC.1
MTFKLNQCGFVCKGLGRDWHNAIVKVVTNCGELYMVFWHYHRHWNDTALPANCLRVVQRFKVSNQVRVQRGRINAWH